MSCIGQIVVIHNNLGRKYEKSDQMDCHGRSS